MQETILEFIKEYKWQAGLVSLAVLVGGFIVFSQPDKSEQQSVLVAAVPKTEMTSSSSSQKKDKEEKLDEKGSSTILVDVKGAVAKPGLYELKAGARVNDALTAAGGFAANADQKSINLAQKVSDEAVVYVAASGENISVVNSSAKTDTSSAEAESADTDLVNLNTATEADLQTITGIGAKRAADIIAYREANGGFKSVDDLNQVSGIGGKTLENIRPYVTVD
ncbi:helix-hairpin-helix domain-containing protein [Streptococcus gallinaceus]|uniref:Competence protein ComEA n=1 Tax=Streptococcus gallinaceus TaxID=165758 RepID=A0ABV2JL22_9STRE|nr:helix-hairpin-helix domain-containing protein [Streptococcus gallinaceus]MCP1638435.1 competence protein ComEA [Streptococcus gallinaceus]MCP1769478.1 competence protein ComEA [Streptococcus gallinaceus]